MPIDPFAYCTLGLVQANDFEKCFVVAIWFQKQTVSKVSFVTHDVSTQIIPKACLEICSKSLIVVSRFET